MSELPSDCTVSLQSVGRLEHRIEFEIKHGSQQTKEPVGPKKGRQARP